MEPEEIDARGTFHKASAEQAALYDEIRTTARAFAHRLNAILPESREKSLALGYLLDHVVMHANAAIARRT